MGRFRVHVVRFFTPQPLAIHSLKYCQHTKTLALSRSDNSVEIWNLKDGTVYQEKIIPPQPGLSIEALFWCQSRLLSVGLTGVVCEFDLVNLKLKKSIPTSFGACWCAAVNSDETHIAVGFEDGYLCLFFVSEETIEFERTFDKQEGRIMCLSWHASGKMIVSGSVDTIRVWDVRTGQTVQRMTVGRSSVDQETVVWCIGITGDNQIVSGDSRGHISFWDARQGVLIQSIRSHQGGILCMNFEQNDNSVCVAGVDSQLVTFRRVKSNGLNQNTWVQSHVNRLHTHDVRAMVTAGDFSVSGGLDTCLVFNKYPPKVVFKYPSLPHGTCAQFCESTNCILLQYSSRLELWRLGNTRQTAVEGNTYLTLSGHELLLMELKAKKGELVMASAISADSSWLAYSSNSGVRLFQIIIENVLSSRPRVSIMRVSIMQKERRPARCLKFDMHNRLIALQPCGDLLVLKMDRTQAVLLHHFKPDGINNGCHLLSISKDGTYAAVGTHCGQVIIFDIKEFRIYVHLPQRNYQATAISFMPNDPLRLILLYQDKKIRSFDVKSERYEKWSLNIDKRGQNIFSESNSPLRGIAFDPNDDSVVILHDDRTLYLLNTQLLAAEYSHKDEIKSKRKYEHLVHFLNGSDDFMIAIQVTPLSLVHQLPAQLKQKKYGT